MKQFSEMDETEQKAILLEKAKKLLLVGDMANAEISWLSYTHNAVFLLRHEGISYLLKMAAMNSEGQSQISFEYNLLHRLNQFAKDLQLPIAVKEQKTSETHIALYQFMDGKNMSPELVTVSDLAKIGSFLGKFHQIPRSPYIGLVGLEEIELLSDTGHYALSIEEKKLFSIQQLNLMDTISIVVKAAMNELGQGEEEFGLIHGDLLLKNILFHEGEVRALDFEYCGWGYYLYDLCPLLWQLKPLSNYKELEEALWQGYTSIRPLSKRHREFLETFIAARQVASMRWVAANQHNPAYQGKVEAILQQRSAELQGFLETGMLKRS